MGKTAFESVEDYIAAQPLAAQPMLNQVRAAIRAGMPGAVESIAYDMPAYALDGRRVLYFAGWKKHFAVYPLSTAMQAAFAGELASCVVEMGTIRFPLHRPLPAELIERLAAFRAGEGY